MLFDYFHLQENIYDIIFSTPQQSLVARVLINHMKKNNNELSKTEMSAIATQMHEGTFVTEIDEGQYKGRVVRLSYNKRQFYERILTPMKSMGLIDYDLYKKTYTVSKKFHSVLGDIGVMWNKEVTRPVKHIPRQSIK